MMFKLPNFLKAINLDSISPYELVERMGDYGKPQEDFIYANINEFKQDELFKFRAECRKYFENNTDIEEKERFYFNRKGHKIIDHTVSNTKLKHAMYRKLINQKVNYLLSKMFSIKAKDETAEEVLNNYFNPTFLKVLQNCVRYSVMTGISWLQVYYNSDGELRFKRIPETEVIPFWADADHTILDAVIRFYTLIEYTKGGVKVPHTKVEYYTLEGVWFYEMGESGLIPDPDKPETVTKHFNVVQNKVVNNLTELDLNGQPIRVSTGENWNKIPFVPIKYNTQELPLLTFVKTLLDDYDKITSDIADNIHDIPLSVRIVKNYDGTNPDEFLTNLRQLKLAFVAEEGDVSNLEMPLDLDGIEKHLIRLRKDIYENGCGVDTQDENMRDTSGEALKFRYIDLSLDCQDLGVQVSTTLENLAYFIFNHEKMFNHTNIGTDYFQVIFNTDMITNESQTIVDCQNSVGIVSNETILSHHPYVTDVKKELDKLKAQQEEEQKAQIEMEKKLSTYGSGGNN